MAGVGSDYDDGSPFGGGATEEDEYSEEGEGSPLTPGGRRHLPGGHGPKGPRKHHARRLPPKARRRAPSSDQLGLLATQGLTLGSGDGRGSGGAAAIKFPPPAPIPVAQPESAADWGSTEGPGPVACSASSGADLRAYLPPALAAARAAAAEAQAAAGGYALTPAAGISMPDDGLVACEFDQEAFDQ